MALPTLMCKSLHISNGVFPATRKRLLFVRQ